MKNLLLFFKDLTLTKKLLLTLVPITTFLVSMKTSLIGLVLLIILDLLTGIRKSFHNRGVKFNPLKKIFWLSVKSYMLRQTWRKAYEYGIGIIVVVVFESTILGSSPMMVLGRSLTLSELAVLIPAVIELHSVFENMEAVSGVNILKKIKALIPANLLKLFSKSTTTDEQK